MNPESDWETRLRTASFRRLPEDWKATILARAAKERGDAARPRQGHAPRRAWLSMWFEPSPAGLSMVAAIWIVIGLLAATTPDESPAATAYHVAGGGEPAPETGPGLLLSLRSRQVDELLRN